MKTEKEENSVVIYKYEYLIAATMTSIMLIYLAVYSYLCLRIMPASISLETLIGPLKIVLVYAIVFVLLLILTMKALWKIWPKKEISLYRDGVKISREEALKMEYTGLWYANDDETAKKRMAIIVPIMVVVLVGLWKLTEYLLELYLPL